MPKVDKTMMENMVNKVLNEHQKNKLNVQLSGKIYEYFIGRDETAISELGAYFTDRHITKYNDEKCLAEEKDFLKSYSIPMIQLDPFKTIIVISHGDNTFNKNSIFGLL